MRSPDFRPMGLTDFLEDNRCIHFRQTEDTKYQGHEYPNGFNILCPPPPKFRIDEQSCADDRTESWATNNCDSIESDGSSLQQVSIMS